MSRFLIEKVEREYKLYYIGVCLPYGCTPSFLGFGWGVALNCSNTLTTLNISSPKHYSILKSHFLFLKFQSLNTSKRLKHFFTAMGASPSSQKPDNVQEAGNSAVASKNNEEWEKQLTSEQFYVTRQKGTERAFTGEYWNTKTPGTYHCICCDTPLFDSSTKFDSGTGWPSYYETIGNNVKTKLDMSIIFMPRQEVVCATCEAHLGHVFDDGPPPSGKRYCINSVSLKLKPK